MIGADWLWVIMALVLAQLAFVASAVETIGSVPGPLPFGRVVAVEVANAFSALAGGTAAVFATRVRFFQQQGYDATVALSSGAIHDQRQLDREGRAVPRSRSRSPGDPSISMSARTLGGDSKLVWVILAVVVAVALAAGLVLAVPRLRRLAAAKAAPEAARHLGATSRS